MALPLTYIVAVFTLNFLFFIVLNPMFNFDPDYQFYHRSFIALAFHGLLIGLQNRIYEDFSSSNPFEKVTTLLFFGGLTGYITNYLLYENKEIAHIVASSTAFAIFFTGLINLLLYHCLRPKSFLLAIICSGFISAVVDPTLFYFAAANFGKQWLAGMQNIPAIALGAIFWSYAFNNPNAKSQLRK